MYCDGYEGGVDIVINGVNMVKLNGYHSLYSSHIYNFEELILCQSEFSCVDNIIQNNNKIGNIISNYENGIINNYITNINNLICNGNNSCMDINLLNANNIIVNGNFGLINSTVNNVNDSMIGNGTQVFFNTIIKNVANVCYLLFLCSARILLYFLHSHDLICCL